ncbi:NUDIX domain-containing protein [Simiduia curdlanivorans]|uniref:NUDIX domain-containing protein n=1 Tax=Simiduia curdlanivorans TaxID=1492769 RepID=A0ABV8V890_9GAMM|nr:NUDIX domain-containing protein [Simiduia curdlanivorans]MDN3639007.1 NUDIX domain-containing protein [Simiduia curdlanivorans]
MQTAVLKEVTIDNVIFGLDGNKLQILLVKHAVGESKGSWGLPGGRIGINQDIDAAAAAALYHLTGARDLYLEQFRAFGKVDRARERVLTIAYYALVRPDSCAIAPGESAEAVAWFDIKDVPRLIFDHREILDFGLAFLRHKIRHEPIGFNLLPEKFTLLQLQELYEGILDVSLDKPNFRRKMTKMNLLVSCNEKQQGVAHRAATLYRFDPAVYESLMEQGFVFVV